MVMMRGAAEDLSIDDWFNQKIWPMEVNLTAERVRVGARLACAEMLLAGVTTFVDHYFHADQIAEAAFETGIRADLAPTFFSSTGAEGREAAYEVAREIRAAGATAAQATDHRQPRTPRDVHGVRRRPRPVLRRSRAPRDSASTCTRPRPRTRRSASQEKRGLTPIQVLERTGVLEAGTLIAHGCGIVDTDLPIL